MRSCNFLYLKAKKTLMRLGGVCARACVCVHVFVDMREPVNC